MSVPPSGSALSRSALLLALCALAPATLPAAKVRLNRDSAVTRSLAFPGLEYDQFRVVDVDAATAASLVASGAGEVLEDADVILLNAERVDTTKAEVKALRRPVAAFAGKRLHLVQFSGPIKQEWVDALLADGLQIVTYIPSNAYLVYGDAKALGRMQSRVTTNAATSAVQWEGAFEDRWKVAPRVLADAKADRGAAAVVNVQLVADKEANDATLAALQAAGGYLLREPWTAPGYVNFTLQLDPAKLDVLTSRPDVVSVHRWAEPKKKDEAQAMVLAGNLTGNAPNAGNYFTTLANWGFTQAQFDASNLAVDVSDDGVDNGTTTPNHFVLYRNGDKTSTSRLVYRTTAGTAGTDAGQGRSGHGQLNASIIGGFVPNTSVTVNGNTTTTTTFPHADAQGFRYGLGIAPFVKLGNSTIFDPNFTNPNYATLLSNAYNAGARVSSNSWGAGVNGAYDSDAQSYDNLVRDSQTGTTGNQQMVVVFAAGNDGSGASTMGSPGTAKNVITVGAAEGVRSHATAAGGLDAAGNDGCATPDAEANSANDIVGFSSRGPCTDSRVKPDIVAGGTHITGMTFVTATSTLNGTAATTYRADGVCGLTGNTAATGQLADFFPTQNSGAAPYNQAQQWWSTSSGTSHSTPAIAGAAALVFQQFINNPAYLGTNRAPAGSAPPSPALVKGYLMNSTRYMTGVSANDKLPSNNQGMGHGNLGMAFDGVGRIIRDQVPGDRFTASGQSRTFIGTVTDNSKPFRVTLAWTDKSGPTTGNAYVNNLDLTVTAGGNTYRGNVFNTTGGLSATGGTADARNNVESVFLPAGTTGNFVVTVTATNIAGQADPTVTGNNQDFALIVYNGTPSSAPVVGAGTPVLGQTGILRPNECNTLTIPLSNTGNVNATAVSAVLSTSTPNVTVTQASSTYADLVAGGPAVNNATAYQVSTAAGIACGTVADFTLTVTYTGGGSPVVSNFSLPIGQVPAYTFAATTGATVPTGGTLVTGTQTDDAVANITVPFAFSLYGTAIASGSSMTVSTNGTIAVGAASTNAYANAALPVSTTTGTGVTGTFPANLPTIFVYWDDLNLPSTTATNGVYTLTSGTAPNRTFTVIWRGVTFSGSNAVNCAVVFREGSSTFDLIYQNAAGASGSGATIGIQSATTGTGFTQFLLNTAGISSGTKLTATLGVCTSGTGPCGGTPPSITSGAPAGPVIVGTPFTHTFTASGSPAPTFAVTAGTLPSGLTLSPGGVLSGTATSAGSGTFSGITVTASNGNNPPATQTFTLTAVTRSANYIASFGLTGNDALPGADPNGDGVTNMLAYALGLSPVANAGAFDQGTIRNYGGTNYYSIRFNRSAVATDLTYIVEASDDITGAWTELARSSAGGPMVASGGVVVSDAGGPPTFTTEVRDTVPVPPTVANPRRFLRLRVTNP
ncbi:MAG: S8 family serine peptidase [Verrucomicrobia bacterium]|nr:S8 family serine peptidase [Verrucomicrobiota bacterium]